MPRRSGRLSSKGAGALVFSFLRVDLISEQFSHPPIHPSQSHSKRSVKYLFRREKQLFSTFLTTAATFVNIISLGCDFASALLLLFLVSAFSVKETGASLSPSGANESESQDELVLRSSENVHKDYTVIPKNSTQAQSNQTTVVDPTIVARDLQNLTAVHPLQTSTEAAKLEVPTTKNEVMVKKSDDQNLRTSAL
ncbi:uncharacterized protein LOC122050474 [Zingiber officinale]|uniref:uncharacterized protein LOC122050474 n=1 Tax=Zingiber officinale TaxID=94328 RepID=UPI001C4B637E|nr:uncharacterized protein LOC122050474 [Zingiber officinale]